MLRRRPLNSAILAMYLQAKTCARANCRALYVGGRRDNVFCSERCAKAEAQRAYRARGRPPPSEPDRRIFREMQADGSYGPDHVIEDGPYEHPGLGTWVELDDGWYRLRRA